MFWRSQSSGGRSTQRAKVGKQTAGQAGDVAPVDSRGEILSRLITFELKRGYNSVNPTTILDVSEGSSIQEFEKWISQAEESRRQQGSFTWAIVHKRDRRETVIYFPRHTWIVTGKRPELLSD